MEIEKRIIAFAGLGKILRGIRAEDFPDDAIEQAFRHNAWLTKENTLLAIRALGEMLEENKLRKWIGKYPEIKSRKSKVENAGVIMAGNIPMAGFHDFLCVLISGNCFYGKLSSDDAYLLPAVSKLLFEVEPKFKEQVHFSKRPFGKNDAISAFIATGTNNSARYFEYYFGKYPHIIRRNRNSVAILDGNETASDLKNIGKDIFQYFGLGCRNVSKIFIPEDYNLDRFFTALVDFGDVIQHNKYANNYHYNRTIYLLNSEKFLDNNFFIVKESNDIASPVSALYYERYKNRKELMERLEERKEQIQCIVSDPPLSSALESIRVKPGHTQSPELWDYADGVDTMKFLLGL